MSGHITISKPVTLEDRAVALDMEPSALVMPPTDEWVDLIAGYEVMGVKAGRHDGADATLITLGDSLGQREVGILRLRNDAVREAQLEVIRLFGSEEGAKAFIESLKSKPALLDNSWEQVEARTIQRGDRIFLDGDPSDPDVNDLTVAVTGVELSVYEGQIEVEISIGEPDNGAFHPCAGSMAMATKPNAEVWVKRG